MYHEIQFSKKVNVKGAYNSRLSIADFFICLGSAAIPWLAFSRLFPPLFQITPAILGGLISFALVSPSGVPDKKNYQMIWQVLRRPRGIYHSIDRPMYLKVFKEEDQHGI